MYVIKVDYATPAFDELTKFRYEEIMEPVGLDWDEEKLSEEESKTYLAIYNSDFKLLGTLKMNLTMSPEKNALLEEVIIAKDFRNQGLGTQLVNKSAENLKQLGFDELQCSENDEFDSFLVKTGFEKKNHSYSKKI